MIEALSRARRLAPSFATCVAIAALPLATACRSDGSKASSGTDGGGADSGLCTPATSDVIADCTVGVDRNPCDVSTLDLPIDTLELPVPVSATVTDGLNVDFRTTSSASDPAGCFAVDTKATPTATYAYVDNAMAGAATALSPLGLDLSRAFANAVDRSTSSTPPVDLSFRLGTWRGTASDECVTVYAVEGPTGILSAQLTSFMGGVSYTITGWPTIPLSVHLARSGCTPDPSSGIACEADVAMPLEAAMLRLHAEPSGETWTLVTNRPLEPAATTVANPSLLGGAVRFWDQDGLASPRSCDDGLPNAEGTLAYELAQAAPKLGLDAAGAIALCEAFASRLDARLGAESHGVRRFESCGTTTTTRPNALTVGLYLGSGYVAPTVFRP